jgi:aspartate/methionine/tyrosine aminotransferase
MTPAQLNQILAEFHPAARLLLSPLGERAALPLGIPQQSAQARDCLRKATIGEITDSSGEPLVLPSLARYFANLEPRRAFRYAPQHGVPELRAAWKSRMDVPCSLPVATTGISHAISLCAELFSSPERPVLLATPYWDNYDNIFTLRTGAPLIPWRGHTPEGAFDLASLGEALRSVSGPATLILNFPNNPTGYSLLLSEVEPLLQLLLSHPHPLCVLLDDAYQGLGYDEDVYNKSLFSELSRRADPRKMLVCKADGATKEMVFFGGRVGFLTFSADGPAGEALAEKAAALIRATISSVCAVTQMAVFGALQAPEFKGEVERMRRVLEGRYRLLKATLLEEKIPFVPFNSGCFALLPVKEDCEAVRQRLIREQSVGVIAVPSANALRVAFCSMDAEDIPDLVSRIARVIRFSEMGETVLRRLP